MDLCDTLVMIRGAGDLASGVAVRLHRCGFPVVMTELPQPLVVRRTVAFGEAVYEGEAEIEGVRACLTEDVLLARWIADRGVIPVLVDPTAGSRAELAPAVLVDAIMAKRNTGTQIKDAPLVVALGPGFTAGVDCHVVVETNRGHRLGRTIYEGAAEPDTGLPGEVGGKTRERVLRAPQSGVVENLATIGDWVVEGQAVARVDGREVLAAATGVLRGLVRTGTLVDGGVKIGDVDPRADPSHCRLVSEKALAVAGGVLEAILAAASGRTR